MNRARIWASWLGLGLMLSLLLAPGAVADWQITPGSLTLEVLDAAGNPENRAGAHPDRMLARVRMPDGADGLPENPRELVIDFPAGMGGDPAAAPACPREVFDDPGEGECPPQSQIGVSTTVERGGAESSNPVYNLATAPGEAASFGISQQSFKTKFSGHLRPDDYGLEMRQEGMTQLYQFEPTVETRLEFWGVPADRQVGTSLPRLAFLTNPTACNGPIAMEVRMRTWQRPTEWGTGTVSTGSPLTGCQNLLFAPRIGLELEGASADLPTGLGLELVFPQTTDPDEPATAQMKTARIELPRGMGVSLAAAQQMRACSDTQFGLGSEEPARCPAASKVGTVEIGVPQLAEPMSGNVYMGQEHPDDRYRTFVVARSGSIEAKFVGSMRTDPVSGRLTTVLSDMPQLALSYLLIRFDGGSRALLVAPECGPTSVDATLVPNNGAPPSTIAAKGEIAPRPGRRCGAPAPFAPTLSATTSARLGGRPTSFSTIMTRPDGDQAADRFDLVFPAGLSANLASIDRCSEAGVAAGDCPASSRLGRAFVDLGSGPETAELEGSSYLTGPYRRAPFGFALILDAKVGPFDLGSITVRTAMRIDPLTGRVSIRSDSMPQTFEGVPIHFQRIGLDIDRPGLMRTPTSCAPLRLTSTIRSTEGAVASPAGEFSVHGCVDLPFKPSLGLALTDRSELHRRGRPGLRTTMRSRVGEANLRSMGLSLPAGLRFSAAGLREICSRRDAFKGRCPKGARVGTGFGQTPLLKEPMKGAIYVVQPEGDGEPDLWANLRGEGVELDVRSVSVTRHGHVESRFQNLPDMSLGKFRMQLFSGKHGVLVLDHGLCVDGRRRQLHADVALEGQNRAYRERRVPLAAPATCDAG
jgi:hypothetical protein